MSVLDFRRGLDLVMDKLRVGWWVQHGSTCPEIISGRRLVTPPKPLSGEYHGNVPGNQFQEQEDFEAL